MIRSRHFGALSLALLLAACGGERGANDTAAGTAPGELPPDPATAPATLPDASIPPPTDATASSTTEESTGTTTLGDAATDADASTPVTDPDEPVQSLPPNPARDPDPVADDPARELQESASPPPPVQR